MGVHSAHRQPGLGEALAKACVHRLRQLEGVDPRLTPATGAGNVTS